MRVDFSGEWRLNKERSTDPDEMLTALGVPWIAREGLKRAGRKVVIQHRGLQWTEDTTTAVITRRKQFTLDGTMADVINPIDSSIVRGRSYVTDRGRWFREKTVLRFLFMPLPMKRSMFLASIS